QTNKLCNCIAKPALRPVAAENRQGTKSRRREVWPRAVTGGWDDLRGLFRSNGQLTDPARILLHGDLTFCLVCPGNRFTDCLGIGGIILVPLHVWPDMRRRVVLALNAHQTSALTRALRAFW